MRGLILVLHRQVEELGDELEGQAPAAGRIRGLGGLTGVIIEREIVEADRILGELGRGALRTGEPVIIDIFPRNRESLYYGDCTRTVVHGEVSAEIAAMPTAALAMVALAASLIPSLRALRIRPAMALRYE